jgi:DmsE family decaheme c-type cytochrome
MGLRNKPLSPSAWPICASVLWLAALISVRAFEPAAAGAIPAAKNSMPAPEIIQGRPPAPAPTPAPSAPGATYVGDEKCLVCHAAQGEKYHDSPHGRAMDARTPAAAKGCETCHGPGSLHADSPLTSKVTDFTKAKASVVNATCTTCHNKGEHALWDGSKHEARGLSCTTCHSVHSYASKTAQLKAATEPQLCATCHRDKVAKLDRENHMPVSEGKMTCSTCHSPHGSTNVKLLKKGDSVNDACTSCHADKRGPYLWEHAPVRQGCTTCHDPHGSQNDSMLVAKLPMLCQRCHISTRHPSTLYDATQLAKPQLEDRGCVNCHIQVHGSMHPAGQFFLR